MWLPDCSEGLEDRPNHFTIHPKGQALETMRGLALALMRHWTPHWRRSRRTREVSAGWTSITVNSRKRVPCPQGPNRRKPRCFPKASPGERRGEWWAGGGGGGNLCTRLGGRKRKRAG